MSNILIVVGKVTLKGMVFLETMVFLSIIHSECLSLLGYAEGMAKTDIGIMNLQQEIFKAILLYQRIL